MNAAGQALIEFLLLTVLFVLIIGGIIARNIPMTFKTASPVLGAKVEQRLATGVGFMKNYQWNPPSHPEGRGGAKQ